MSLSAVRLLNGIFTQESGVSNVLILTITAIVLQVPSCINDLHELLKKFTKKDKVQ